MHKTTNGRTTKQHPVFFFPHKKLHSIGNTPTTMKNFYNHAKIPHRTCSPHSNFCKNKPLAVGARPTQFNAGEGRIPSRADWFANPPPTPRDANDSWQWDNNTSAVWESSPFARESGWVNWCYPCRTATRGGSMTSLTRVCVVAQRKNVIMLLRSLDLVALSPIRELIARSTETAFEFCHFVFFFLIWIVVVTRILQ